ncbi:MAG TPA: DUF501 domain-containing protein [Firmicutes bacterium]|nr:DUF501 domain-containing protein [Bacillota bacterium]
MDREIPSPQDRIIIEKQIGRRPRGLLYVATRCPFGAPQVIITHPLPGCREHSPRRHSEVTCVFPTVYWLTCPALVRSVSVLEASGEIERFKEIIEKDKDKRERLAAAHREYARDRVSLLTGEERAWISHEMPGIWKAITTRGVAGIRPDNYGGIKCLHGHYAHYVAGGDNPVGELVSGAIRAYGLPESCGQDNGLPRGWCTG